MKKTVPQFLWSTYEVNGRESRQEGEGMSREEGSKGGDIDESNGTQVIQCMITLRKQDITHQKGYWGKYGLWRQEQKTRAARLQKQLKARWESEESIHDQLNRFHAHYQRSIIPTKLNEVSQLLMPSSAPPHELATLAWLGDWRPSSVLELLCGLAHCSSSSCSPDESNMSQLIHEVRIEEAVIDEEMAEIQATCVLHLPFVNGKQQSGNVDELSCIETEFRKIQSAIAKAQQLRFKTLELLVKKVLGQTKAAEFFVAFVKVQEAIHNHAARLKLPKGPLTIPVKHLVIKGSF